MNTPPTENDVTCGRGKNKWKSPGNRCFKELIHLNLHPYAAAKSKGEKSQIVRSVVASLKNSGNRFVRKDPQTLQWDELTDREARTKVAHALRDYVNSPGFRHQRGDGSSEDAETGTRISLSTIPRNSRGAGDNATKVQVSEEHGGSCGRFSSISPIEESDDQQPFTSRTNEYGGVLSKSPIHCCQQQPFTSMATHRSGPKNSIIMVSSTTSTTTMSGMMMMEERKMKEANKVYSKLTSRYYSANKSILSTEVAPLDKKNGAADDYAGHDACFGHRQEARSIAEKSPGTATRYSWNESSATNCNAWPPHFGNGHQELGPQPAEPAVPVVPAWLSNMNSNPISVLHNGQQNIMVSASESILLPFGASSFLPYSSSSSIRQVQSVQQQCSRFFQEHQHTAGLLVPRHRAIQPFTTNHSSVANPVLVDSSTYLGVPVIDDQQEESSPSWRTRRGGGKNKNDRGDISLYFTSGQERRKHEDHGAAQSFVGREQHAEWTDESCDRSQSLETTIGGGWIVDESLFTDDGEQLLLGPAPDAPQQPTSSKLEPNPVFPPI